ncbi:hypothetical protein LDL08_20825 [Nonomuraea glycinis]|nr:hypothetical protein [Nonomuraea glycinis]MCA2178636.1 hypothetical protein [Nonomuraea glycinis]
MSIPLAISLSSALLFSGTAAYPVNGAPGLTANALYARTKPVISACVLSKGTTEAATRGYLAKLVRCLNTAWAPVLRSAGFKVRPASLAVARRMPKCGGYSPDAMVGSAALICERVIRVQLGPDWVRTRDDRAILVAVGKAYGRYLQEAAGIDAAQRKLRRGDRNEGAEQGRRYGLQSDCLAGVTLKGVWGKRPGTRWATPMSGFGRGFEGTVANRRSWLKRGFAAGAPSVCNTWVATSKAVA